MKILFLIASLAFGFFDIKSLHERYEYYLSFNDYLQNTIIGLKPIARLTVAAAKNISKGDKLLVVPDSAILTTFDDYPWASYFKDQSPEMILSTILISYKLDNSSSLAHSMFAHQFTSDIEPPSYWLEDELKVWLGKFVENPQKVRLNSPEYEKFKDIAMRIEGTRSLGYEVKTYAWAQAIARYHGIEITKKDWKVLKGLPIENGDSEIRGLALVPLFELFNQYLVPDNYHPEGKYPVEFVKGSFILRAQRDFKTEEETYVPYKGKNNYQLTEDFGFSIPYNRHDRLEIKVKEHSKYCEKTSDGCVFSIGPISLDQNYLEFCKSSKDPLASYRQGIRNEINKFKFGLRHQRRRVKILDDRHIRQIFHLSISEKWVAYKALALVEREILKSYTKSLNLVS